MAAPVANLGRAAPRQKGRAIPLRLSAEERRQALVSHTAYALALHRSIRDAIGAGHGAAWSPYSVWCSLAMAAIGARGETAEELAAVLTPGHAYDQLPSIARDMPAPAAGHRSGSVSMSNTAWLQDTFEIEPDYRSAIKVWAGGDVRSIDFEANPELARQIINRQVADSTHDLIRELIDPEAIDDLTVLVLANALYSSADWSESFNPRETTEARFHGPDRPLPVAMMHSRLKGSYAATGGWQAVGLPCRGDQLAVTVLLPDQELSSAEDQLAPLSLLNLHDALRPANLTLALPRFRLGVHLDLKAVLMGLGVRLAFSDHADFSGITPREELQISFVAHETILTVNEAGIEATAATATGVRRLSAMAAPEVTVNVDRPFLLTVRDPTTNALLFLGRVTHPES
jgi:serine protease inhibitor